MVRKMTNVFYETKDGYLAHWGFNSNHKYIMKVGEGPNARYLYTQAEVDAYRRGLRGPSKKSTSTRNQLEKARNKASSAVSAYKDARNERKNASIKDQPAAMRNELRAAGEAITALTNLVKVTSKTNSARRKAEKERARNQRPQTKWRRYLLLKYRRSLMERG